MAVTPSTMLALGTKAPGFKLPDTNGKTVTLEDFDGAPALLVVFMCNHCPYVKHIRGHFAELVKEYRKKGVRAVAISSNDVTGFPEDSPENMKLAVKEFGYTFPYLYDESQKTAQAYRAACTPDFFLFDGKKRLVYRGQMDASRPGNDVPLTGEDLRGALDAVIAGKPVNAEQRPSIGCNIKWKPGNEPDYFTKQP